MAVSIQNGIVSPQEIKAFLINLAEKVTLCQQQVKGRTYEDENYVSLTLLVGSNVLCVNATKGGVL